MTSNDKAWSAIFDALPILNTLSAKPHYLITAREINEIGRREARLMAKFDTQESLPELFKKNELNITAVSNGSYIIFKDKSHSSFINLPDYSLITPIKFKPSFELDLQTLAFSAKMSESNAIDYAHHAGILSAYSGEKILKLTTRGRFFSDLFTLRSPELGELEIKGVQIEVDAGYEGLEQFLILEAKSSTRSTFNIRQLYYPYMHFVGKTNKRIKTVLLFFSNGIYYFTEIRFGALFKEYEIAGTQAIEVVIEEAIPKITARELMSQKVHRPQGIPVPQADDLNKVIDLLSYLSRGDADKYSIAEFFEFNDRQGDYYGNAAAYIGLASKKGRLFSLTNLGKTILQIKNSSHRNLELVSAILRTELFNDMFQLYLNQGGNITDAQIVDRIGEEGLTKSTPGRRKSTVRSWMRWIQYVMVQAGLIR
jgi:hypothetical protein